MKKIELKCIYKLQNGKEEISNGNLFNEIEDRKRVRKNLNFF
jgi:hypothetical protein